MDIKKFIPAALVTAFAVAACNVDDSEFVGIEELGLAKDFYEVEAEAGLVWVDYFSNGCGNITFLSGDDWARLEKNTFSGDGKVGVEYDDNDGFGRMASIIFNLDGTERRDTMYIKQKGLLPVLKSTESTIVVYNGGSETHVPIETNISMSQMKVNIRYSGEKDWITAVSIEGDKLYLSTTDNTDPVNPRSAVLTLIFVDGWQEKHSIQWQVTQANATNKFGEEISFEDLRAMATPGVPVAIEDKLFINGYVVSDKASLNVNDIPSVTTTTRDYSINERSACVESLDGRYGFMVVTETEEDNIFLVNTKVQLNLNGTVLTRYDDPERYEISGVSASMLTRSSNVDPGIIPQKRMHISELTDSDIYTRVCLTDCEFPVRKGSISPVHEGYTLAMGAHRVGKAAVLIRDIEGSSMYVYTNTTCPYRRDGSRMGYGQGTMSGIIVHEKFRSFVDEDAEDEDFCGNIGRYQIRHQSKADFGFADSFADSFSEMICEWRYLDRSKVNISDNTFGATYGEGRMRQSYTGWVNSSGTKISVRTHKDMSYLGPIGSDEKFPFGKHIGNRNGYGIILEDGTDYGADDTCVNTNGNGLTNADCNDYILTWASPYWWSSDNKVYSWEITFSTKGISTDRLSMQFAVLNQSTPAYTPRFWKAEWVEWLDEYDTADAKTVPWQHIADYTVPDIGIWANTLPSHCLQFKPMDFPLPLEMLNLDKVRIRLTPRNHLGSNGQAYANTEFIWGGAYHSTMDYFAIRYNK